MVTKLKEVDVVTVGVGLTGTMLAKELTLAGLTVVGLERGPDRKPHEEFVLPRIRDELKYNTRMELMQDNSIDTITFRDLLTHKAGFRVNCNGSNTTYAVLKQQIANGVQLADKTTGTYNNCNFAIFRELLPFMEGSTPSGSDAQRAAASAALYINYMNQNVFQPVGVSGADCKPPAQLNPAFASVLMLAGRIPKMRSSAGEMAKIEWPLIDVTLGRLLLLKNSGTALIRSFLSVAYERVVARASFISPNEKF